jgi:hypothetical protein
MRPATLNAERFLRRDQDVAGQAVPDRLDHRQRQHRQVGQRAMLDLRTFTVGLA